VKTCEVLTRDVLTNPVLIHEVRPLDFGQAREIADQKARELVADPMLLAWYEAKSGKFSPPVECCSETKPGWLVYAESRGGTITIDINNEEYIFIYLDASERGVSTDRVAISPISALCGDFSDGN
jgi:hypothetical protein